MFILIASDSPGIATKVRKALAANGHECPITHLVGHEQISALMQAVAKPVDVLFLVLPADVSRSLGMIRRVRSMTGAQLVVVGSATNSKHILEALHAGADDYIDEDSDFDEQLCASFERIEMRSDTTPTGRLVAVTSASGGCGATTIAANLAVKLAQPDAPCGLLELVSGFGDLSALFNVTPRYTIADLLRNQEAIDRAMLEQSVIAHASGVRLLASQMPFDEIDLFDGPELGRIVTLSRSLYAWTVVDLDSRAHRNADLLKSANTVVMTTRLDFTSLCNTRRLLECWRQMQMELDRVVLVGNRVGQAGEVPLDQAQTLLGKEIAVRIPDDVVTANVSANCGNPAVLESRKSLLSRALSQLADRLLDGTVSKHHDSQAGIEKEDSWHGTAFKKVAGILFC